MYAAVVIICAAAAVMYAGYSTLLCCVCHNS